MGKRGLKNDGSNSLNSSNSTDGKQTAANRDDGDDEEEFAGSSGVINCGEVENQETPLSGASEVEDESGDGESDDETESAPPATKKQRVHVSAQDIQVARETAELFKSNIFKLQIDELMKEVKLRDSHIGKIEKVLHRLHDLIGKIPATDNLSLSQVENSFRSKKIVIPFPDPKPTKVNYTFSYLQPEDISLVGSFGLKSGIAQKLGQSIDIAITMPKTLFQPKDYLNYRALYKRAFYLAHMADNLIPLTKKNNLPVKITYKFLNDDVLCPVLRLESIKTDNENDLCFHKTHFTINLIAGFPFGVFDSKKLLPDKNCIRVQSESSELPPTPLYNSSILSLTAYEYYLKYLYATKKSSDAFREACVLGKLWLQQRSMHSSFNLGGFGHFEFAILMSVLLNGGGLNGNKILLHGFSSYQLFKGTIKYLATMDLAKGHLTFTSVIGENGGSKYILDSGFGAPAIFDKNIKLNILWKMTQSSYRALQKHAEETLTLLNDIVQDRFDQILLQPSNIDLMRYDIVVNMTIPDDLQNSFGPLEKISFITFDNFIKNKVFLILKNALGERVNQIHIRSDKFLSAFSLNKRKPNITENNLVIGLVLNPEESDKVVTKGPDNSDEESGQKFRSFWGNVSSLRRFKNGSIQHCVVWPTNQSEPIVLTITKHVLDLHLSSETSQHISYEGSNLVKNLPIPLLPSSAQLLTSTTSFLNVQKSFDTLSKTLTTLELPLKVKTLLPASPALRYSSLLQPVPFAASSPNFWNDAVLQFETSTRWPDEISALEKTKTAFLLKISELLTKSTSYKCFITRDESVPFNESICLLNVLTSDGFGFRIRVLSERDEVLYLRAVNNEEKHKAVVQDIYLKFNQIYLGSVKHTRTVTALAHHFHYFSPTVRLFKRWLDSQLLLCHFPEELVELIVLKSFLDPAPYSVPHSVTSGFLLTLNHLAQWNWKDDPLILDLSRGPEEFEGSGVKLTDKLSIQLYQLIEQNFKKIRKNDPSGIKIQLFVGSKDDPSGILWSNDLTLPIASRLTALARVALQLVVQEGLSEANADLLFTPALKDYDFVIQVKTASLSTSSGILPSNAFKNLIGTETNFPEDICTKYDLIQAFVGDLKRKFGNAIIFSTKKFSGLNENGSNVICGIFVPNALNKRKFKVNIDYNVKPVTEEEVVVNKEAIFDQICLLGGDLIHSIKVNK